MLTVSGADRAQIIADLTNASVFFAAVREANRRKLGADRDADASAKRIEAITGQLAALGDPAVLKERKTLLDNAEITLERYRDVKASLDSLDTGLTKLARLDEFIVQARAVKAPPKQLRTLLQDATVKRMLVDALDAEMLSLAAKQRKIAQKQVEVEKFEQEYHELLLQRSNTMITCPKCGEEFNAD